MHVCHINRYSVKTKEPDGGVIPGVSRGGSTQLRSSAPSRWKAQADEVAEAPANKCGRVKRQS